MKEFYIISLISLLFINKVISDCFSTKLGYPCCESSTTKIIYTDSDGDWGVEHGEWCGITSTTTSSCWAEVFGYQCCKKSDTKVKYTDKDGSWSIENGNWCGILSTPTTTATTNNECWSKQYGYPCCLFDITEVSYTDSYGKWGIERGEWCGIPDIYPKTTPYVTPTNLPPLEGQALAAKNYMDKLKVVNPIPSNANDKAEGVTVKKVTYYSTTTKSDRQLNIIFPPNYSTDKKYPVLYLLHGVDANEDSMVRDGIGAVNIPANLAKKKKAKEMLIVTPNVCA